MKTLERPKFLLSPQDGRDTGPLTEEEKQLILIFCKLRNGTEKKAVLNLIRTFIRKK